MLTLTKSRKIMLWFVAMAGLVLCDLQNAFAITTDYINTQFTKQTSVFDASFKVVAPTTSDDILYGFANTSVSSFDQYVLGIRFVNGHINLPVKTSSWVQVGTFKANVSYAVRLRIDIPNKRYDVFVNSVQLAKAQAFRSITIPSALSYFVHKQKAGTAVSTSSFTVATVSSTTPTPTPTPVATPTPTPTPVATPTPTPTPIATPTPTPTPIATPTPTPTPVATPTPTPTPIATPTPTPTPVAYVDDTYANFNNAKIVLTGDYGYGKYDVSSLTAGTIIDARLATFNEANSKNSFPTTTYTCTSGTLPVNFYPFIVRSSTNVTLGGALVNGHVPQDSDWAATYCNSASVVVNASPGAVIDGVRIDQSWDGLRVSDSTTDFVVKNTWISNNRDDCMENDQLKSGRVEDSLWDGCFSGFSIDPGSAGAPDASAEIDVLSGMLIRMQPYNFDGAIQHVAPIKTAVSSPSLKIYNSIFALENPKVTSYNSRMTRAFAKTLDCKNNVILWLPDGPMPALVTPPSCFKVIQGQAARDFWDKAKTNWINCHPKNRRLASDPASDFSKCDATFFGGLN